MTKITIYFDLKKIGHKFDIYLENEMLTITKHQDVLFKGTLGGFKAAILNKHVMHSKREMYHKVYLKINDIIDKFNEVLSKAHIGVNPPLRKSTKV